MKMFLKVVIFLIIPVTGFLLLLSGVFNEKVSPGVSAVETKEIFDVGIEEVTKQNYQTGSSVTGTIVPEEQANTSSMLLAEVNRVLVKEGSIVKKGDAVIILDSAQVQAQVNQASAYIDAVKSQVKSIDETIGQVQIGIDQAKMTYENDEKTYERIKTLYENGIASENDYDNIHTKYLLSESEFKKAEAALAVTKAKKGELTAQIQTAQVGYNSANVNLKNATLRAPFDGVVVDRMVDVGDMASPGMPLVTIETAPYYLEVFVNESQQANISIDDKVEVTIDSINETFQSIVKKISPRIDPASRTLKVEIQLPAEVEFSSGMFGHAVLNHIEAEGIFIPKTAIAHWSQITSVYVVDEQDIIHLRYVQLGDEKGDFIEVLSGLDEGEKIITKGIEKAEDLAKVVSR